MGYFDMKQLIPAFDNVNATLQPLDNFYQTRKSLQFVAITGMPASTMLLVFITAFLSVISLRFWDVIGSSEKLFRKGPVSIPILGHLYLLIWRPNHSHIVLKQLADTYGEFFPFRLGCKNTVVLNSYELIKEIFYKISDRPSWYLVRQTTENCKGLVWQNGQDWKELRRFSHKGLKSFAVGYKTLEERVQEEVECMSEALSKMVSTPVNPAELLQQATSNITCSLCFGNRFSYEDVRFRRLLEMIRNIFKEFSISEPINFFSILEKLPYFPKVRRSFQYMKAIDELINEQIELHRQSYDADTPRDFVDLYLKEEEENFGQNEAFTDVNIRLIIRDLFIAGSETTATTLQWLLLYMASYPDIQRQCQQEIDEVIGDTHSLPPFSIKKHLPFTEACILEVQRMASVVPFLLHQNNESTKTFHGHRIPKGTAILANVYAVHMSETYWQEPHTFQPKRFIDTEGNIKRHIKGFLPFGIGPRQCPGEYLSRMELFLFFTVILQRFEVKLVDERKPPTLVGKTGVTLAPEEYELYFTERVR